ncbi:MAG TPA: ribonuclease III [Gammaproteobacteria bacterium]|nr:ribonuclease III [Gammaproteobacteria bacterium]
MTSSRTALLRTLGRRFSDETLLDLALTHRSVGGRNNERLEFLGDALINACVADALYRRHGELEEGDLSRLRASLVNQEALAEVARELDLGSYLSLGPGELKSGGHRRASILADALEAVIGAVFLDAGFEAAHGVVLKLLESRLAAPLSAEALKDSKTRLQEVLQARDLPLPVYAVESVRGEPHKQTFRVSCSVQSLDIRTEGEGGSRRNAEQEAARQALEGIEHG